MSSQAFSVGTVNPVLLQPTDSSDVYVRSSQTADTGTATLFGLDDTDIPVAPSFALAGKKEKVFGAFNVLSGGRLSAAQTGVISVFQVGTAATAFLRAETNPADGTTITFGLGGATQAYRFKNTLAQAYDVKIGATATDTMLAFKKAINHDGVSGTDYFAGTNQNPYVSALVSGTIITLTDQILCARALGWSFAQSSTHFSLPATMSGGVDGPLLMQFAIGVTQSFSAFTLLTEDLTTGTLPSLVVPVTDWIRVSGKQVTLRFKCGTLSNSAIQLKYQTSTDKLNVANGVTAITNVDASHTVLAPQYVYPAERNIEYIRLNFIANNNTAVIALDAQVISPP